MPSISKIYIALIFICISAVLMLSFIDSVHKTKHRMIIAEIQHLSESYNTFNGLYGEEPWQANNTISLEDAGLGPQNIHPFEASRSGLTKMQDVKILWYKTADTIPKSKMQGTMYHVINSQNHLLANAFYPAVKPVPQSNTHFAFTQYLQPFMQKYATDLGVISNAGAFYLHHKLDGNHKERAMLGGAKCDKTKSRIWTLPEYLFDRGRCFLLL